MFLRFFTRRPYLASVVLTTACISVLMSQKGDAISVASSSAYRVDEFNTRALALRSVWVGRLWQEIKVRCFRSTMTLAPTAEHSSVRLAREVSLLHQLSIESVEYIDLLVRFGVMPVPFVQDNSRPIGDGRSAAYVLRELRKRPTLLVAINWSSAGHPLRQLRDLRQKTGFSVKVPESPAEQLSRLRESIREIQYMWLVDVGPDAEILADVRGALLSARMFCKTMRDFRARIDPSLAEFVEMHPTRYAGDADARFRYDLDVAEMVLDEADDLAALAGDWSRAQHRYEGIGRFALERFQTAAQSKDRAKFHEVYTRALIGAQGVAPASHSSSRSNGLGAASDDGAEFAAIRELTGMGLSIEVPGGDIYLESSDGLTDLSIYVLEHPDPPDWRTPWLHALRVDVEIQDPWKVLGRLQDSNVAIVLTHEASGKRYIRRLRRVANVGDADETRSLSTTFIDVDEGTYRVEIVARPMWAHRDRRPGGPSDPTGGALRADLRPERLSLRRFWRMGRQALMSLHRFNIRTSRMVRGGRHATAAAPFGFGRTGRRLAEAA
jgi:hypothetical protein